MDEPYRLPQLNSVLIPESVVEREAQIRTTLLRDYKLEIGAGLGALAGKVWRIGLMGHSASDKNIELCLRALREVIQNLIAAESFMIIGRNIL